MSRGTIVFRILKFTHKSNSFVLVAVEGENEWYNKVKAMAALKKCAPIVFGSLDFYWVVQVLNPAK